jgi:YD repeat-containing protein
LSLDTTTRYYINHPNVDGKIKSIVKPDGTMDLYGYTYGDARQVEIRSGRPSSADPDSATILDGTVTTTTVDSGGNLVSRITYNIDPNVLLVSEQYTNPDSHGRPQRINNLMDGTYTETIYGCCGVSQTRDKEGAITEYEYDALRRQREVRQVSLGITITNDFDAAGNVISVTRLAGNPLTAIVQQRSSYDVAGRLKAQFNVSDGITKYQYSADTAQRTITYTNGGTRIETSFKDGQLQGISGTAAHPVTYDYGADVTDGAFVLETKGPGTTEWVKTFTDIAGRQHKTLFAGPHAATLLRTYNDKGQLVREIDPDGVSVVYEYNLTGELEFTINDLNQNGIKDSTTGNGLTDDRITQTVRTVLFADPPAYSFDRILTETFVWTTEDDPNSNVRVSSTLVSTDGRVTRQTRWNGVTAVTTKTETQYDTPVANDKTVTQTFPDGSQAVSVYRFGRLISATRKETPTGPQLGSSTYTYDAHGRLWKMADARNGTTTYAYNNADQVTAVTTPAPGSGAPAQQTLTRYNIMGLATNIVQPDGASVTNFYTLRGELEKVIGSRTYPVGYKYDSQGRLINMTNWGAFSGQSAPRITQWNYNQYRGWLDGKRYPDPGSGQPALVGPDYGYKASGRLETRTWQRGIITTYGYNTAGELESVSYSDSTPPLVYIYDRRGRMIEVHRNSSLYATLGRNDADQLTSESFLGGPLNGVTVSMPRDSYLRRAAISFSAPGAWVSVTYAYDGASRLTTATDAAGFSATHAYVTDSPLVQSVTFKQGSTVRMTTGRDYDKLNRLRSITSTSSAGAVFRYDYQYNSANQRT